MFFRNSTWTREFLNTVWSRRREPRVSEQDVIRTALENLGEFGEGNKHLLVVPQFKLNAYPKEIGCHEDRERTWRKGDWIIHFPVRSFTWSRTDGGRVLGLLYRIVRILLVIC